MQGSQARQPARAHVTEAKANPGLPTPERGVAPHGLQSGWAGQDVCRRSRPKDQSLGAAVVARGLCDFCLPVCLQGEAALLIQATSSESTGQLGPIRPAPACAGATRPHRFTSGPVLVGSFCHPFCRGQVLALGSSFDAFTGGIWILHVLSVPWYYESRNPASHAVPWLRPSEVALRFQVLR